MERGRKQFEKDTNIRLWLGVGELKQQDPLPYGRGDDMVHRVGILKDLINLFGGIRFCCVDISNVYETRLP